MGLRSLIANNLLEIIAIAISFFAITIAMMKDFILPFIFNPKIHVEGMEEDIENATSPNKNLSRWVRLRITNKDSFFSRPAKNCYVKLLSIKNKKDTKITPFNPVPLTWNHYDQSPYDQLTGGKHNLSVGEYHLIDLVHEKSDINSRVLCFKVPIPRKLRENAPKKLGPGEYTFTVGIYGDNFKSQCKEFKIKFPKKYGKINFV